MASSYVGARTGATDAEIDKAIGELIKRGGILEISASPQVMLSIEHSQEVGDLVVDLLRRHHAREPLALGVSREEIREQVFKRARPEAFRAVVLRLCETGKVVAE